MPDKTLIFSDQEQMQIESMLIDKDGEAALQYLAALNLPGWEDFPAAKRTPGRQSAIIE